MPRHPRASKGGGEPLVVVALLRSSYPFPNGVTASGQQPQGLLAPQHQEGE